MNSDAWTSYYFEAFYVILDGLEREVQALKAKKTQNIKGHPKVKLYIAVIDALEELKQNPLDKVYRLGKALTSEHTDWRRIKHGLPPRYRIFFKFFSAEMAIIITWMNDENTLRKDGAKTDCYAIFTRKLNKGEIPSDLKELLMHARKV